MRTSLARYGLGFGQLGVKVLQSSLISYFCFKKTYKKFDNIKLLQVRGTTKYHLSPHEQKAFAGAISTGVPNTLWRIRFSRFLTYFDCCPERQQNAVNTYTALWV